MIIKGFFRVISGIILIIFGILGFLIPIIPGWAFFIPGLIILVPSQREKLKAWLDRIKNKKQEKPQRDFIPMRHNSLPLLGI